MWGALLFYNNYWVRRVYGAFCSTEVPGSLDKRRTVCKNDLLQIQILFLYKSISSILLRIFSFYHCSVEHSKTFAALILVHVFNVCNTMDLGFLLDKELSMVQKFLEQLELNNEIFFFNTFMRFRQSEEYLLSQSLIRVGKRVGFWEDAYINNALRKKLQKSWELKTFTKLHLLFFLHGSQKCIREYINMFCSSVGPFMIVKEDGKKMIQRRAGN